MEGPWVIEMCITEAASDVMGENFDEAMVSRAYNCLMRNKILTVKQFSEITDEELKAIRNVGEKTFKILSAAKPIAAKKYEHAREKNEESYLIALKQLNHLFEQGTNDGVCIDYVRMIPN